MNIALWSSKWKWILFSLFLFGISFYPPAMGKVKSPSVPYTSLQGGIDTGEMYINTGTWRDHYYQAVHAKDWKSAKEQYEIIVDDLLSGSLEDSPHGRGAVRAAGELIRVYYYLGLEEKAEKLLIEFIDCCMDGVDSMGASSEANHKTFQYPKWSILSPTPVYTLKISVENEHYRPLIRAWWLDPTAKTNSHSWQYFYALGACADDWKNAGENYQTVLKFAHSKGIQDIFQAKHTLIAVAELIRIYYHLGLKKEADMLLDRFINEYMSIDLGFYDE